MIKHIVVLSLLFKEQSKELVFYIEKTVLYYIQIQQVINNIFQY